MIKILRLINIIFYMDLKAKFNKKIYIMYHYPCLDGIYSLMNMMMIIKTKVKFDNWTFDQIYQKIEDYIKGT